MGKVRRVTALLFTTILCHNVLTLSRSLERDELKQCYDLSTRQLLCSASDLNAVCGTKLLKTQSFDAIKVRMSPEKKAFLLVYTATFSI